MVTPFDASGAVDWPRFRALIDWQIQSGSHGISVTGTTGEPSALSQAERRRAIDEGASAVDGRVPFVPATGTNNLEETVALTRYAEKAGADAALVIVPYYNRPSQDGLYRYFNEVARKVELPLIIYNIPGRTAVNMAPETMARVRESCPNVIGVKESNKDFEHVTMVLHRCGRDFLLYSGIELLCYPMLTVGAVGYISATANVMPGLVASIWDRFVDGDLTGASDVHYQLVEMSNALFVETNPGPLKWVLGKLGRIEPFYRLPMCEPSVANQALLERVMRAYSLLPSQEVA